MEKATAQSMSLLGKINSWFSHKPIIVFSMGKVGSSSVVNSLRALKIQEVQPHSLTFTRKGSYFVKPRLTLSSKIYYFLLTILKKLKTKLFFMYWAVRGEQIKVISLVRDPLSRTVSGYFEQYGYVLRNRIENVNNEEVFDNFKKFACHETPHIWFEQEIKPILGIDVYSEPFDKKKGFKIYNRKNIALLLVQMERLNDLEEIIGNFIEDNKFSLKVTNRASKKTYRDSYAWLKNNAHFGRDYLEYHYNSKYSKHFYTDSDIANQRSKWLE